MDTNEPKDKVEAQQSRKRLITWGLILCMGFAAAGAGYEVLAADDLMLDMGTGLLWLLIALGAVTGIGAFFVITFLFCGVGLIVASFKAYTPFAAALGALFIQLGARFGDDLFLDSSQTTAAAMFQTQANDLAGFPLAAAITISLSLLTELAASLWHRHKQTS